MVYAFWFSRQDSLNGSEEYLCSYLGKKILFILVYYDGYRQISYWCKPNYRGRKMSGDFLKNCVVFLVRSYYIDNLLASIDEENHASRLIIEKMVSKKSVLAQRV